MENSRADLHLHTYCSDGLMTPLQAAEEAERNGVNLIAVTDHDCSLCFEELSDICAEKGLKTVRGIEVSAYVGDVKIHTLGYAFDAENPDFKRFAGELVQGSFLRAEDILSKLNKNGVKLTMEQVLAERKCENSPVHSMHISRAGAKAGYAPDAWEFHKKYLNYGACAFSTVCRPAPEQTVEVINAAGGFTSLAHPGRIDLPKEELLSLIKRLVFAGLGGIEGVYPAHTSIETAYYKEIARGLDVAVTGGSDTHFIGGNRKIGTPFFQPDETLVRLLKL